MQLRRRSIGPIYRQDLHNVCMVCRTYHVDDHANSLLEDTVPYPRIVIDRDLSRQNAANMSLTTLWL